MLSVSKSVTTTLAVLTLPFAAPAGPLLTDATSSVFGPLPSWKQQLECSPEHWLDNLDRFSGLDAWAFHGVSVGDVNADGSDDLYVSQPGGLPNLLLINNKGVASDISSAMRVDILDKTRASLWVDLDNDSDEDLVVATSAGVAVMENRWPEPFYGKYFWPSLRNVVGFTKADFDGDGHLDLVFLRGQPETFSSDFPPAPDTLPVAGNGPPPVFFRGGPGLSLTFWPEAFPDAMARGFATVAQAVDIDSDARPDLIIGNACGPALFLRNTHKTDSQLFTVFPDSLGLRSGSGTRFVGSGDFNGDGMLDFALSGWADSTLKADAGIPWLADWHLSRSILTSDKSSGNYAATAGFGIQESLVENTWGGVTLDFDLDGRTDLALAKGGVTWSSPSGKATDAFGKNLLALARVAADKATTVPVFPEEASRSLVMEVRKGANWQPTNNSLSVYLNKSGKTFEPALVPALPGDGRSLVAIDWNSDARPDLAYLGRGAPQLGLLLNGVSSRKGLSLKLKGATSSRHSAGAQVVVKLSDGNPVVIPVTEGGNFLGQSTSELFVGIDPALVTSVTVRWAWSDMPESFKPAPESDRWLLVEGTGAAQGRKTKTAVHTEPPSRTYLNQPRNTQIYGTGNEPLLPLSVQNLKGESFLINERFDRPTLLVIFGTSDKTALAYLKQLAEEDRKIRLAGARVIALCVDPVPGISKDPMVPAEAAKFLSTFNLPFFTGLVDESGWLPLRLAHEAPRVRIRPLEPAKVWLLGATGAVHVYYEGMPKVEDLIGDVKAHLSSNGNRWKLSLPFAGRWMVPPETVAGPEMAVVLADRQNPLAAWRHVETHKEYFGPSIPYARFLAELGVSLKTLGNFRESIACFREALRIAPQTPSLMNNLAWVLLITPESTFKEAEEALTLARSCNSPQISPNTVFSDTLSVALAANDLIPDAIDTAVKAMELAKSENDLETVKTLRHRLEFFRQGKPWLPEVELGLNFKSQGKHREAIQSFRAALKNAPNTPFVMKQLAWSLLTASDPSLRDPAEALLLARLCNPEGVSVYSEYLDVLALALASNKKWDEAVGQAVKALESANRENDAEAAKEISQRLELFRQGKSWPP